MGGFIDDEFTEVFVDDGGVFLEEGFEGGVGEAKVAVGVVLVSIDGSGDATAGNDVNFSGLENVDEADLVFGSAFGKGGGIK